MKKENKKTERYLNYKNYNCYNNYKMENTTIAIRKDLKEKIAEFAMKKETYSDVIERLLKSAEQRLLNDVLFSEEGFISLDEFEKEVKKKWPKSK